MLSSKDCNAMVLIAHFGVLPKWFDVWLHTAKLNRGIDFHLCQEVLEESQDQNIFYHRMTVKDFNTLPLLRVEGCELKFPYKFCDFRPLIAETFPEITSPYKYWGWGDLDVLYGDILSVIGGSFDRFDYISTGWQGESGPLAFLRNSEEVNRLWRLIPNVKVKLNSDKYVGIDEHEFISLLKSSSFSCDIVFRECMFDLPARWKDGKLRSLRTDTEYALYHFGGGLPRGKSEMLRKSSPILKHLKRGGALRISQKYCLSRKRVIGKKYCVSPMYDIDHFIKVRAQGLWKKKLRQV
jgi:hypothetical protein